MIPNRFRCVYQWALSLDEGEESGDEEPDPPACNAPPSKPLADAEDRENDDDEREGDEDEEQPTAKAWSGDDEDLIDSAGKVSQCIEGGVRTSNSIRNNIRRGAEASYAPWLVNARPRYFWNQTRSRFDDGSQDMSAFLTQQAGARSEQSTATPWIEDIAPCVPDHDLKLEWIHGYSAQVWMLVTDKFLLMW